MFCSFWFWQLLGRVKAECLMPSELQSIFELKPPNPEGMVPKMKVKQETAQGADGLVHSQLISTTPAAMGARYERTWKDALSSEDKCESAGRTSRQIHLVALVVFAFVLFPLNYFWKHSYSCHFSCSYCPKFVCIHKTEFLSGLNNVHSCAM